MIFSGGPVKKNTLYVQSIVWNHIAKVFIRELVNAVIFSFICIMLGHQFDRSFFSE